MKAKRIWIAQHPTQPTNREASFDEPCDSEVFIDSYLHGEEGAWVEWQEYIMIPIEV